MDKVEILQRMLEAGHATISKYGEGGEKLLESIQMGGIAGFAGSAVLAIVILIACWVYGELICSFARKWDWGEDGMEFAFVTTWIARVVGTIVFMGLMAVALTGPSFTTAIDPMSGLVSSAMEDARRDATN